LNDAPLGTDVELPDFLKCNRGFVNVSGEGHLCFFRCLAKYNTGDRRFETCAQQLFNKYWQHYNILTFNGVNLTAFTNLEDIFKINIVVYQLEDTVAKLVQRSREIYTETMRLNIYNNHLSLITDFEVYCKVYKCSRCDLL